LATNYQDLGDGLLGEDLGNIFRECTREALNSGLGSAGELGDLTFQSKRGLCTVLGKCEEDQNARRGLKGDAPPVQFGGRVFGLQERTRGEALGLTRVLSQPGPHNVENSDCAVPLLAITELGVQLEKTGCSIYSLKRPGVESGLKRVLSRWHRVS
jgi:hypothetical protein